jgi:small-conductance mechanosensitive channel
VSLLVYLVAIVLFLNQLRIASVVLYLVVGAILMLIILTFVVGLKDVIPNIVAWVFIQRKGTIKEGRRVEVREIAGVVENVGYLETEIKTDRGDILYVPNALFMKSKFSLKKEK